MEQPNKDKKIKRPDTPLAATPTPLTDKEANSMFKKAGSIKKPKNNNVQKVAMGVVISKKDEKAHPEDFKYLKK